MEFLPYLKQVGICADMPVRAAKPLLVDALKLAWAEGKVVLQPELMRDTFWQLYQREYLPGSGHSFVEVVTAKSLGELGIPVSVLGDVVAQHFAFPQHVLTFKLTDGYRSPPRGVVQVVDKKTAILHDSAADLARWVRERYVFVPARSASQTPAVANPAYLAKKR